MAPIPVEIQPAPPAASDAGPRVEFVPDLDAYVEDSMCSCNAGDNNPY